MWAVMAMNPQVVGELLARPEIDLEEGGRRALDEARGTVLWAKMDADITPCDYLWNVVKKAEKCLEMIAEKLEAVK